MAHHYAVLLEGHFRTREIILVLGLESTFYSDRGVELREHPGGAAPGRQQDK